MNLYYIQLTSIFAIIAKTEESALEKSTKYGKDGIILSVHKLNKDWN